MNTPDTEDIGWKIRMIGLHHSTHIWTQYLLSNAIIHKYHHEILHVINNEQKCSM